MIRALLLFLGLVLVPAAAQAAPAKDWSQTVTLTKEGAHVIGNPAAKTRLVEYVSYTCPHCAHFVAEGTAPLKAGWVSRGTCRGRDPQSGAGSLRLHRRVARTLRRPGEVPRQP
jgi:hypothetical protein